ncbi:MAG: 6-hydroxymethylpterin diphosphokinase MptE-like protein [Euryarchaeota archaeon]|nr:6-hydroxymethylpterin diphosphokinase MptE-like protein [Euryarchaeota archaeon]
MDFNQWEPIYQQILDDLGFSREEDETAALLLSNLLVGSSSAGTDVLDTLIRGRDVLVCGNAPCLSDDLDVVEIEDHVVIAADGATTVLLDREIIPDIIVTDLDGDIDKEITANQQGAIMVVHAHGDNTVKLLKYVPLMKNIIGTTQAKPLANVHNFGGFSDGDRCVFLALEFNASSITLAGFDLNDENVDPIKKKKLQWAHRLLRMIANMN